MIEAAARNPLKILGTTTSAGGYFGDVKVTGECRFTGDVDCLSLSLTGETVVAGSLRMDKMKITGELAVEGIFEGDSLRGQGEIKAASTRIDQLNFNGNLEVRGDCEAEELRISGAINVAGLLNAEQLEINLFGPCAAKEVGGSAITIKRSKAGLLLNLVKPNPKALFTAGLIEGDRVDLNYTKADVVRGDHVIIGADCEINTVEYRSTLELHKLAKVKHQVKL